MKWDGQFRQITENIKEEKIRVKSETELTGVL